MARALRDALQPKKTTHADALEPIAAANWPIAYWGSNFALSALAQRIEPLIVFCQGNFHGGNACETGGTFAFYHFDCLGLSGLRVGPRRKCAERIEAMGQAFLSSYARRRKLAAFDAAITSLDAILLSFSDRQFSERVRYCATVRCC